MGACESNLDVRSEFCVNLMSSPGRLTKLAGSLGGHFVACQSESTFDKYLLKNFNGYESAVDFIFYDNILTNL